MSIGIIVPHLGSAQLSYLAIAQANAFSLQGKSCVLFYEDVAPPCIAPNIACMNTTEIWGFNGLLVATSLGTAQKMIEAIGPAQKTFYVWDLEWLRRGRNNFRANVAIYRDPSIKLIARSKAHAKELANYANREVDAIIPDLDIIKINELQ